MIVEFCYLVTTHAGHIPNHLTGYITKFPEIGWGMIKPDQEHLAHHAHHTRLVMIRSDIVRILGTI